MTNFAKWVTPIEENTSWQKVEKTNVNDYTWRCITFRYIAN